MELSSRVHRPACCCSRQPITHRGSSLVRGLSGTWLAVLTLVALPLATASVARAHTSNSPAAEANAAASDHTQATRDQSLAAGLELERAQQWGDAIDHYESASRAFPEDRVLYQRLLISRLHFDVKRRYDDKTYLTSIRELTTSQALDLYSEILANLQTHYVDTIEWSRVLLHGTAALEVALTEEAFVNRVVSSAPPERIEAFRQAIHHRVADRSTQSRFDLRATVNVVAKAAHDELGISGTATVLEYVSGAVSTLDPYTRLLSPGQLDEMFSTIEGNFVGLGVELKAAEDCLLILSVIPNGPAAEAGIMAGDRILAVDATRADEHDPDHIADLLRGPEGTTAELLVESTNQQQRTLSVVRRRVDVPCVENIHIVDQANGIGYFRLTNFQKTTPREIEQALWSLHRQGMRSLVMDLRDNPGGLLSAAVEVADRFIPEGRIVTTRGRNARENFDYAAHRANTWDVPMVVLIDRNSASASEIFSGAIHDSQRGAVIGETSYGKGSVQGIFRMQAATFGLCLTTAKFYSPSGRAISLNGVEPNIVVPRTYIAARPDDNGRLVTELDDAVLQKSIEYLAR
ncbi:carboxyl-terminal processing protease [Neorhodopirellula lusitana]|uniref:Carboxyl-terminal processing protease n=1 Tax=Neorhodopirellula lusitana TaxID=445327 RepID=A0ABY1Q888_9BACT|nr:S41 family peptidase [Neorhodopirellula lusitana]SMP62200.1 carboxyl-terminal processing protease [Neorhodopirellula lusitana]